MTWKREGRQRVSISDPFGYRVDNRNRYERLKKKFRVVRRGKKFVLTRLNVNGRCGAKRVRIAIVSNLRRQFIDFRRDDVKTSFTAKHFTRSPSTNFPIGSLKNNNETRSRRLLNSSVLLKNVDPIQSDSEYS